ncbi:MAG: hypothetical protein QGH47_00405 [Candidatus Woesearchaeota archaeon]|jgi:hypothetical protein|nr:hypothetical protein [Candidatus Woesearchaeota archaeon]
MSEKKVFYTLLALTIIISVVVIAQGVPQGHPANQIDLAAVNLHFGNGNIGMGIQNPAINFRLQVNEGPTAGHTARFTSAADNTYLSIENTQPNGNPYYLTSRNNGMFAIHLPGAGDLLVLSEEGKVGIGTSNPTGKLEVHEPYIKLNSPLYPHFISWTNQHPPSPTTSGNGISSDGGTFGWHSSPHTLGLGPEYAGIDFGGSNKQRVTKLVLIGHQNPFGDFQLQASNDATSGTNGNWITLTSATFTPRTDYATQEFTFTNPTAYRWYRLKITSSYVGGWAMFGWKLMGPEPEEVFAINDGQTIRRITRETGLGPVDETDNGPISSRQLRFNKKKDNTAVRIGYTDNLRVYGTNNACSWEIKVDSVSCPGGALIYDYYVYAATGYENTHRSYGVFGYCEGLSAGDHQFQVYVSSHPAATAYANSNCYTGWHNSRWTLEAEEVY